MGSAISLPTTIAHVCRTPRRRIHGTRAPSGSVECVSAGGLRYRASHSSSHRKPSAPTATNAQRQPHVSAIQGTTRGVTIALVFVPALKIPVASARSSFGNHSPTLLIEPGKLADSPNPSIPRAAAKAAVVLANAVLIAATLQRITAGGKPRRRPTRIGGVRQ